MTTAMFTVEDPSQVAEPRRAIARLAAKIGFDETGAGRAALVVTELATNLAKHARNGRLLMRALAGIESGPHAECLEIVSVDRGPGIEHVARSQVDGYSTSGTLGHGLGAIERQADYVQIYTNGTGTVVLAQLWRREAPPKGPKARVQVGGVHVAKDGETVSGDAWAWRLRGDRLAMFLADGLGHGVAAHDAAMAAVSVFERASEEPPQRVVSDVHAALRSTRGAAVGSLVIDFERGLARYCGLGNIAGALLQPSGARQSLVSHNGTAGHTAARLQEFQFPAPPGSLVVMHSDGVSSKWDLGQYPGLQTRHPSIIAAVLHRDFARSTDDATVVVAKDVNTAPAP